MIFLRSLFVLVALSFIHFSLCNFRNREQSRTETAGQRLACLGHRDEHTSQFMVVFYCPLINQKLLAATGPVEDSYARKDRLRSKNTCSPKMGPFRENGQSRKSQETRRVCCLKTPLSSHGRVNRQVIFFSCTSPEWRRL